MKKCVIVGGLPRSGTNLVRRIIGSHSKIAIPPVELKFLPKYGQGKSVAEILSDEDFVRRFGVDVSDLHPWGHQEAYVEALARYAASVDKEIPGEKTPRNEFYYDRIQAWLAGFELKFIHLVRNPFDMIASLKHAPFRGNKRGQDFTDVEVYRQANDWSRSVSFGLARARFAPEHYFLLKYEDLAARPVELSQELCNFIGVDFEQERMLNLADYAGHKDNTSFAQGTAGADEKVGRVYAPESRKGKLTEAEIRVVSAICGELAWAMGYDDQDFQQPRSLSSIWHVSQTAKQIARRYHLWPG